MASCPQGRPSAEGESPVRLRLSAGHEPHALSTTRPYAQWLNALKEREAARQTPPLIS
mgnify:FL=1